MPCLPRLTALKAGLSLPRPPAMPRVESPAGGSTLMTRAPMSASNIAQYGPAITWVASRTTMPSSNVAWDIDGSVGTVTLTRPAARNALTWEMYDAIVEACDLAEADPNVRVLIIRGSGGAFSAGTDISQFRDFVTGADGVAYERRIDAVIDRIERLPIATIAEVDGAGGGRRLRDRDGVRPAHLRGSRALRRAGGAHARQLPVDGEHRAPGRSDRPGADADLLMTGRLIKAREAMAGGLACDRAGGRSAAGDDQDGRRALDPRPQHDRRDQGDVARLRDHRRPPPGSADDIIREATAVANSARVSAPFLAGRKPIFPDPDPHP